MLKVHVKNFGSVAILCLQGRVIRGETKRLHDAVDSQLNVSEIILDLARVSSIDAGGLGVMLELRELTESRGIGLKLKNVSKLVNRILEITRLDSVFDVESEADVRSNFPGRMALVSLAACA